MLPAQPPPQGPQPPMLPAGAVQLDHPHQVPPGAHSMPLHFQQQQQGGTVAGQPDLSPTAILSMKPEDLMPQAIGIVDKLARACSAHVDYKVSSNRPSRVVLQGGGGGCYVHCCQSLN
jgi:hypothetical protein